MANILEEIVVFFESLNEREMSVLTSDEEHFKKIAEIVRLSTQGNQFDSKTAYQLMDHYRGALNRFHVEGEPFHIDIRPLPIRMKEIVKKGKEKTSKQELYGAVVGAIQYTLLVNL